MDDEDYFGASDDEDIIPGDNDRVLPPSDIPNPTLLNVPSNLARIPAQGGAIPIVDPASKPT